MGRKYVYTDDLTGDELPDDTKPILLSLGRTSYSLYLSEDSHGKLLDALTPFIKDAEKVTETEQKASKSSGTSSADKEHLKAVREWAIATKFEYKNAAGETKTVGDRGRIPSVVVEAYEAQK